jgi:hypothetical protein
MRPDLRDLMVKHTGNSRTSEPAGTNAGILAIAFVVHKHSATADHCDPRLELNGVLALNRCSCADEGRHAATFRSATTRTSTGLGST